MKKNLLIFIFSNIFIQLLIVVISNSQPSTEWVQRYNSMGNQDDYVSDMVVDKSGNVYITGYIKINNSNYDFITLKYFSNGNLHWARTFDANQGDDKGLFIGIDNSGNVYVTGKSNYYTNRTTFLTIKYSNDGNVLWVRNYTNDTNHPSIPEAMVVDDSGNVYITGSCFRLVNSVYTTLKYNTNGDTLWVSFLNGSANAGDIPYAITLDKNHNVYITGQGREVPGITIVNKTVKYDNYGNQKWVADYFGSGIVAETGNKICTDDSGFAYVGGYGFDGNQAQNDYRLLKYDSNGVLKWMRYFNGGGSANPNDYLRDMTLDKNGNIYVTGSSATSQLGWDYLTIKYKPNGDSSWIRRYNPVTGSDDVVNSITVDKNGNVYLTGYSDRAYIGYNYATVKYNSSGAQQWDLIYNNNTLFYNHYGVKVALDSSGNIYVTGYSQAAGTGYDIATIKYSGTSGIQNISGEIPRDFKLYQNYPNPFNPSTNIKFDIPSRTVILSEAKNPSVSLKVFDLLGREISTLVNENLKPGTYDVKFDGSNLSSGIYFYSLIIEGKIFNTKKLILIK